MFCVYYYLICAMESRVQPIDFFIARANSFDVDLVLKQANDGAEFTRASYERLIQSISDMFDSMSNSSSSLILELLNAPNAEGRKKIAGILRGAKLSLANVQLKSSVENTKKTRELEERLGSAEKQLSGAKTDLEKVKEELHRKIDALKTKLQWCSVQSDDDDDDDDKEKHTDNNFLTNPEVLYITRRAWAQAVSYVVTWRKTLQKEDVEDATEFIHWLSVRRIDELGATPVMKLLQHATIFDVDWIDPIISIDGNTEAKTIQLLRDATSASRVQNELDIIKVTNTLREPNMTHVVYSQTQWPLVVAALRLFASEHWGEGPFLFLRWLHADEKRLQLLALISHGNTEKSNDEKQKLADKQQEYFELVIQQASDQLELNLFDFIPVPRETVVAQLTDALKVLDDELPKLMADFKPDQLQDTKTYADILKRLKSMRKQLAVDWLERLSRQAMTELIDQSMLHDTPNNRDSVVDIFYQLLHKLDTETAEIKWII